MHKSFIRGDLMGRNLRRHQAKHGGLPKEDAPGGTVPTAPIAPPAGTPPAADFTSGESNNTGETFDAGAFWGEPDPNEQTPQGPDADAVRNGLTESLANLNFGAIPFDNEIAEQINSGNFDGINQRLQEFGTNAVKQSLAMTVSILKPLTEQILTQVRAEVSGTMSGRDDADQLVRDFPSAKDPKIRPVVQNLYTQALKNTKGNRAEATAQVKSMMALITQSTSDDLGLDVAPRGADDFGRSRSPTINWLDELSGR